MTDKLHRKRRLGDRGWPPLPCRVSLRDFRRTVGWLWNPWIVVTASTAAFLWTWWDSQADQYAGLPINILGQVLGDLLVAGLVLLPRELRRIATRDRDGGDRSGVTVGRHRAAHDEITIEIIVVNYDRAGGSVDVVVVTPAQGRETYRHVVRAVDHLPQLAALREVCQDSGLRQGQDKTLRQ